MRCAPSRPGHGSEAGLSQPSPSCCQEPRSGASWPCQGRMQIQKACSSVCLHSDGLHLSLLRPKGFNLGSRMSPWGPSIKPRGSLTPHSGSAPRRLRWSGRWAGLESQLPGFKSQLWDFIHIMNQVEPHFTCQQNADNENKTEVTRLIVYLIKVK